MGALLKFLSILGKITGVLPMAISIAEVIGGLVKPGQKSGPEKLAAVQAVIRQSIQASELVVGKDIIDEDLLNEGITEMVNAAVKIMNATKPKL